MSDEQLQRDVADIRVIVAETALRVRGVARGQKIQDRRIDDLDVRQRASDRWRYKVIGAGAVIVLLVNLGAAWVMR